MIAIAVNAAAILAGSGIGLLVGNRVRKSITDSIMVGIGLFTVYTGITGLTTKNSSIIYLLALVIGGGIGTALQLTEKTDRLAQKMQNKLTRNDAENRFAAGLTGFFIVSCVGAYTIVASFNAGLGDNTMLYTKAVMDFAVSMAMASSLGIGVLFSGIPVVLYEILLVAFSGILMPLLSEEMLDAFSCTGAILTVAIGLNLSRVGSFKVVNFLPSLILAPLLALLFGLWG